MKNLAPITTVTLFLGLAGCAADYAPQGVVVKGSGRDASSAQARRTAYVSNTPGLSEFTRRAILEGRLRAHMDPEEVVASWGEPQHIQHWMNWDLSGDTVEWLYGRQEGDHFKTRRNVYLIDDEVWLWYVHPAARKN